MSDKNENNMVTTVKAAVMELREGNFTPDSGKDKGKEINFWRLFCYVPGSKNPLLILKVRSEAVERAKACVGKITNVVFTLNLSGDKPELHFDHYAAA